MESELKKLRVERGETQMQLAQVLGLKTASAYCKKENGNVPLSLEEVKTFAKYYDRPVSFFCQ